MKLLPIDVDDEQNAMFTANPECRVILDIYPDFYKKVGYNKPWIGYFAVVNTDEVVGCGGFKGQPVDDKVEIAYGTFKSYEGKGIGKEICRQLVLLSLATDPSVRITARTLPGGAASAGILRHNGFECLGFVMDADDGEVLEWEFKNKSGSR
jgi:ribosomal-protein-alanine N-acetyltransferase